MVLKDGLTWWYDLSTADANIIDQHSGLSLAKYGTITAIADGGPDGGPCLSAGVGENYYQSAAIAPTIPYGTAWSFGIWAWVNAWSSTANTFAGHMFFRGVNNFYWLSRIEAEKVTLSQYNAALDVKLTQYDANGTGSWHLIGASISGDTTTLYVDGAGVAVNSDAVGSLKTGTANVAIFNRPGSVKDARQHVGRLSQFGVWSRSLSSAEWVQLYNGGAGLRYAALDMVSGSGAKIARLRRAHAGIRGMRA